MPRQARSGYGSRLAPRRWAWRTARTTSGSRKLSAAGGKFLALAVGDVGDAGAIDVLDAATGGQRFCLAGHRQMIWQLAFSPDGKRLASLASFPVQPAEVKLWDLSGGHEMLTLKPPGIDLVGGNGLGNSGFAFSADGRRLSYLPGGARREAVLQVWGSTPMPDAPAGVSRGDSSARTRHWPATTFSRLRRRGLCKQESPHKV
jgi:WD40 repeat protein